MSRGRGPACTWPRRRRSHVTPGSATQSVAPPLRQAPDPASHTARPQSEPGRAVSGPMAIGGQRVTRAGPRMLGSIRCELRPRRARTHARPHAPHTHTRNGSNTNLHPCRLAPYPRRRAGLPRLLSSTSLVHVPHPRPSSTCLMRCSFRLTPGRVPAAPHTGSGANRFRPPRQPAPHHLASPTHVTLARVRAVSPPRTPHTIRVTHDTRASAVSLTALSAHRPYRRPVRRSRRSPAAHAAPGGGEGQGGVAHGVEEAAVVGERRHVARLRRQHLA